LFPEEPGKVLLDPMHSAGWAKRSSTDFCDSGTILKASAAALNPNHFQRTPLGPPPGLAVQSQQKDGRKRRTKRRSVLLIATQLNELQTENPDKIVIVRKINRLGFASADILKEHFGKFGTVNEVRLSNAHNKEAGTPYQVRLRPSGIAFVVFDEASAAAQVLAEGETRMINGVEVWVRGFERRRFDDEICEQDEIVEKDIEETSSIATASTRCSIDSSVDHEDESA
jgi:hypothetical protein